MRILNLGILAHVDAGKTSLTERLLYDTGTIASLGSVDAGTTRTDSMDLERRRGITIRTHVAAFHHRGVQVQLIDTPGHADFVAEVERSLAVLDAAVLVVSAVEGVQPQTVVLWRALRRLRIPTLLFVNKADRAGADIDAAVERIRRRLAEPAGMTAALLSDVASAGTAAVRVDPRPLDDPAVLDALTWHDDALLEEVVNGRRPRRQRLTRSARGQVAAGRFAPVLAGSAVTGAGVAHLLRTLIDLVPAADTAPGEHSAVVFKIEQSAQGPATWVRVFGGTLAVRDRFALHHRRPERVTGLRRIAAGGLTEVRRLDAGEVGVVRGLTSARIGDWLGVPRPGRGTRQFPPPALESVVEPVDQSERGRLHAALSDLAQADPLINLRVDPDRGELAVSLFGEVQKEVIASLLSEQYGLLARFSKTTTVHLERILGCGAASAILAENTTPYLATLGVRLAPAPPGSGIVFALEVELGSMPPAFFAAAREGVRSGLAQGRSGWEIRDAEVTITHTGYLPRQSAMHQKFNKRMSTVAADFRLLGPVLVHTALRQAGTVVCEPIERFTLELPVPAVGPVSAALGRLDAVVTDTRPAPGHLELIGHLPTRNLRDLAGRLPDLARGEAILTSEPDHYTPVAGRAPRRARIGADPLDRETWFRENPR